MKKPLSITINAVILAMSGVLMLLGAIGLAFVSSFSLVTELLPISGFVALFSFLLLGFAVIEIALAYFLYDGNENAWWILVIFLSFGIVGNLFTLFTVSALPVLSLLVQIFLLAMLFHKSAINYINPKIDYSGWELEE